MTHVNVVWIWASQYDRAFSEAKNPIANDTIPTFVDVKKPRVLQVDASDTGLARA